MSTIVERHPFEAHGKTYEVRITLDGADLCVRAYQSGRPANGYSYHVDLETGHDFKLLKGKDAVNELVRMAKEDVIQKRYERLLALLRRQS